MAPTPKPNRHEVIGDTAYLYTAGGDTLYVDAEDLATALAHRWNVSRDAEGIVRSVNSRTRTNTISLSRTIMSEYHDLTDMTVDHIDRNPCNNRKSNLRVVTQQSNLCNRASWGVVPYRGVTIDKRAKNKKYKVQVACNGKTYHGGMFTDVVDAAMHADELNYRLRGPSLVKSALNFPHHFDSYVSGSL